MTDFIVKDPYPGWAETFITTTGVAAYTEGLTAAEYIASKPYSLRIITEDQLREINEAHIAGMITDPVEITEADFDSALGCLPPARWQQTNGVQMFHISERITGDLVAWFAAIGDRYFRCEDLCSANLSDKFKGAL